MRRAALGLALPLLLAAAPDAIEQVTVQAQRRAGGGLIAPQTAPRAVSEIGAAYVATQPAIGNAFQYAALLPGANVSTSDPYGLSVQFNLSLRGLGDDELGYTLDGMPLNDIGFYVAYPSQFLDSENIASIRLAQGSGGIAAPVISAAGGLMEVAMRDPPARPGGTIDASYGSYHANREFVRLDSGDLGQTGFAASLSYSHTAADNWRGSGRDRRQHVDLKMVRDWGGGSSAALTLTWHDGITSGYPRPTLAQFQAQGRSFNYAADPGGPNYWALYQGTFRIVYVAAPVHVAAGAVSVDVTPYWQYGYGNGPYGTTLTQDGNYLGTEGPYHVDIPGAVDGVATVQANYADLQYRAGLNARASYRAGRNTFMAGAWFDYSDETDTQSYSALGRTFLPADIWVDSLAGLLRLSDGRLLLAGQDHVITQSTALFAADTLRLADDRLELSAGFRALMVARAGTNGVPGPQYRAGIDSFAPLPRLSASYRIGASDSVFASVVTNTRTPSEASLFTAYSGGLAYAVANTNLRPEYSISEELGWRRSAGLLTGAVTLFNYNFTNRQIATLVGANAVNQSINAGGQTSRGVDAEIGLRPWHALAPYASFEYLHATIDNDLAVGTDLLPTAGRIAVRSPAVQAGFGLNYDDGTWFGQLGVKYVGAQYATFLDDERIGGHATADLALGVRVPAAGGHPGPQFKLNLINLTDANDLSGIANPTANARPAIGRRGTLIVGNAPTYYIGGGFAAIVTATQDF